MLWRIGAIAMLVVLAGCGSDGAGTDPAPSATTAGGSLGSSAPALSGVATPAPTAAPQQAPATDEPVVVVPSVPAGDTVELQIPPLSEQPAPGTAGQPSTPSATEEITCATVCTSTGCEQYQYSVLGCP